MGRANSNGLGCSDFCALVLAWADLLKESNGRKMLRLTSQSRFERDGSWSDYDCWRDRRGLMTFKLLETPGDGLRATGVPVSEVHRGVAAG
jgi:hypothetical protein